ncbi:Uncharacterised protein [Segatella copri]|nr:Uncharacterised protein [Segatella copri]
MPEHELSNPNTTAKHMNIKLLYNLFITLVNIIKLLPDGTC